MKNLIKLQLLLWLLIATQAIAGPVGGGPIGGVGGTGSAHGNGSNCPAGSYPLGVDANGAVESCTDASTEIDAGDVATASSANDYTDATVASNLALTHCTATNTVADSGDANPATVTVSKTSGCIKETVYIVCNDTDGCTASMGEVGAASGDVMTLVNISSNITTLPYSANVLEHNCGPGESLSLDQTHNVTLTYSDSRWIVIANESAAICVDSINIGTGTIQGASNLVTSATAVTLTVSQMNSAIVMTGAGDVDIPANQCDTATGQWVSVTSVGATLNSLTSLDGSDQFILIDGTALTAGNELDNDSTAGSMITVVCLQANKWWVRGYMGAAPTDGGAAD